MPSLRHKKPLCIAMISGSLLTGGLAACSKSPDVQALVSEAGEYHRKGDNKAAVIQLKNALQQSPEDMHARLLLGTVYLDTNDPQSAEKELRKAIELGMARDKALPPLARSLIMQGKFEAVLAEAGDAPDDLAAALARGNAFLGLGKGDEAKQAFELARKLSPDHPDVLIGLARHATLSRDTQLASRYADEATARNPANADAWQFKADLLRAQNKAEEALAAYEEVLKIKPNAAPALVSRAGIEIGMGKYDAARANLEAARKAGSATIIGIYTQALLEYREGKHAAALEQLQRILRSAPDHMPSQLLAGSAQYALGATQQAEVHLKTYLDSHPKDINARKLYAAVLLKNGEAKRAQTVASEALKDAPQDPQLLAIAGESSWQSNDLRAASDYFKKASAIAPQDAMIRASLGKAKLGQGDSDAAIAEFEKAYALDKKDQTGTALVLSYVQQKRFDKALELVNGMEKEQPKNARLRLLKGAVHLARNDTANARKSFEEVLAIEPLNYPAAASLANLDVKEGKPDSAKKRLESLLEKDPKNPEVLQALGALAAQQKQNEEATRWFERAHAENPDAMQAAGQLFMQYVRNGQKQKALSLAQKLQSANPQSPEALEMLGNAHFANGNREASLEAYEKLAVLKPDAAGVHYHVGILQLGAQKQAQAAAAFKKALALHPDYIEAHLGLASIDVMAGRHEPALGTARNLQKQHPKSPAGHLLEGEVLMAQKKPALAAGAFERAFAAGKNGQTAQKLHAALVLAGKEKEADSHINEWLKAHPNDSASHAYLALHYLSTGQNKQAIRQYETIVKGDPKNVRALNNLAWAYQQEKDSRALKLAENAYGIDPRNPAVMDTLGGILVENGEVQRGLELLEKAVAGAPDAPDIRLRYAEALVKAGDKEKARSELKTLVDSGKDFPKLKDARALLAQL